MTNRTLGLDDVLHQYLLAINPDEHPVMRELRDYTASHRMAKMQIAPEQGHLLRWLTQLSGARRYLEIGVYTGYSTLAVALAMPEQSETLACDISREFTEIAQVYWQKAGVAERIQLVMRPAKDTLQYLLDNGRQGYYDMAFIDADKANYRAYYEACLQLVRPGGLILIDNIFLSGRTSSPSLDDPMGVHRVHEFNASLRDDPRVNLCVLPVGDGLSLCIKRP